MILTEEHFTLLNRYISADMLRKMQDNMKNTELIIPVIGLQGVGKSTLINSILKENIMPNEADETTCIPVEVRYGNTPTQVFYRNGKKATIDSTDIANYVDNCNNPGNIKEVSQIVIYREIPLLKTGIVLVDLPGVGSMTVRNQETTLKYIERAYMALFVLRVNPPITRTEANIILFTLGMINNAWFVQNRWNNESEREVTEGREANETILSEIAQKCHHSAPEVLTVNAYKALSSVVQGNTDNYNASGINVIQDKLLNLAPHWKEIEEKSFQERVRSCLVFVLSKIEEQLTNMQMSRAELEEKLSAQEQLFAKNTSLLRTQLSTVQDTLIDFKTQARRFISKDLECAEENLRSNLYRTIDGGVTDGEDLTKAFRDNQIQEFTIVQQNFLYFLQDKIDTLNDSLEGISKILTAENKASFTALEFDKKQEFKWEKTADFGLRLGGAVGGGYIGSQVGAAVGTVILPVLGTAAGTALGAIVGLAIGSVVAIFVSAISGQGKQLIVQQRISETKRQLSPYIEETCETMRDNLTEVFYKFCNDMNASFDAYLESREEELIIAKEQNCKALLDNDNSAEMIKQLIKDRELINGMVKKLNV